LVVLQRVPVALVDTGASMFIDQKFLLAQHHRTCLCIQADCVHFLCSHDHSITELNMLRLTSARGCYSSRWGLSDMAIKISACLLLVRM